MIILLQEVRGFPDAEPQRNRVQRAVGTLIAANVQEIDRNVDGAGGLPDDLRLDCQFLPDGVQHLTNAGAVPAAEIEDPLRGITGDDIENPAHGIVDIEEIPDHAAVTVDGDRLVSERLVGKGRNRAENPVGTL